MTKWTPQMLDRLRELHRHGMLFKQIALTLNAENGTTLTRNAVIGKAHRLQLLLLLRDASTAPERKIKRDKLVQTQAAPPLAPVVPGALTMLQLGYHSCRWPSGEERPPYTYCGEPTYAGGSFCKAHYRLAYVKPRMSWA
jgi:GcrA cell cycle regulator